MDKYKDEDLSTLSEAHWQLLSTSFKPNKELAKIKEIADLITNVNPDICLFTEVGGAESLDNFNQYFLSHNYLTYCEQTNSDRGIDLGIMINKSLGMEYECKLNRKKVFARGVYHLKLDIDSTHSVHFLLTHLKSKLSKINDFEGRSQRGAEIKELIKFYQKIEKSSKQPLFICGDLNGIIYKDETEPELAQFANLLGLKDVLELLDREVFERTSYVYYNTAGDAHLMQLDYCLADSKWRALINENTSILDFNGQSQGITPSSRAVKIQQPSDHQPLFVDINLDNYLNKGS